jgi:uncharacterized membrane-anchored protein
MNKINNPLLEEMYKEHYKEFEQYIYKRDKELQKKSETTLESLAVTYDVINQIISDSNEKELLKNQIKTMIKNYTDEFEYVTLLFYKYGIINGIENHEKLKHEL